MLIPWVSVGTNTDKHQYISKMFIEIES